MAEATVRDLPVDLRNMVTSDQAWHYRVIPRAETAEGLVLETSQEPEDNLRMELEVLLGRPVTLVATDPSTLDRALSTHYRRTGSASKRIDLGARSAEHVLQDLVQEARELGSSDIHLEAYDAFARVRIRIDGLLVERFRYGKADHPGLVNRVKVSAGLDISEKRLPQDGRMVLDQGGTRMDIRVSVLPTLHGEKVVLRIFDPGSLLQSVSDLGFFDDERAQFDRWLARPTGLVLVTGPTGSGKTTTLYSALAAIARPELNVVTVEDPIELVHERFNQIAIQPAIDLTFSTALRHVLRQDPDVIMLGEIRDSDTARHAVQAALTGHLVLSTLHTNSAWGTVGRLLDMGLPPFLLAGTLNTSVAQRLLRLLCTACSRQEEWRPGAADLPHLPDPPAFHRLPVGCPACHYTGYRGRHAVYEVIALDAELQELLRQGRTDIAEILNRKGQRSMTHSAAELLRSGRTSLEEAYPILSSH
jgi:type IV pilus assembly protein PilB